MPVARPTGMIPPPPAWGTVAYAQWLYTYQHVIPSWAKRDPKTGQFTVVQKPIPSASGGGHGLPDVVYDAWASLYSGQGTQQNLDIYTAWNNPSLWNKYVTAHQNDIFNATTYDGRGNRIANHPTYSDGWTDSRIAGGGNGGTDPNGPDKNKTPEQIARERDALTILRDVFTSYDLASLVPRIEEMIKGGIDASAVPILLQETPEYKQRFAANEIRKKNGLSVLSPDNYIATEKSIRQVMMAAGLPTGFYDQREDFTNLIAADVSPTELKSRVDAASEAIHKVPASALAYFKQWYSTSDLVAFALDPTKAEPLVEKRIRAAEAAAIAGTDNVNLSQATAENIGAQGFSLDAVRQRFGFIGQELPNANKLDQIYGQPGDSITPDDMVNEVFFDNATQTQKRQKLASQERAAFSGTGAANSASLATEKNV